jgi:hypothetical protein
MKISEESRNPCRSLIRISSHFSNKTLKAEMISKIKSSPSTIIITANRGSLNFPLDLTCVFIKMERTRVVHDGGCIYMICRLVVLLVFGGVLSLDGGKEDLLLFQFPFKLSFDVKIPGIQQDQERVQGVTRKREIKYCL